MNWPQSPTSSKRGRQPRRRDVDVLEQSLADGDRTSAELRDRCDGIEFWRENQEDRRLIKHALALYSDVEAAREQLSDYRNSRQQ